MALASKAFQLVIAVTIISGAASSRDACAGDLIPIPTRKDHVFDPVRRILYITTTSGTVERWDVDSESLLTPWTVGGELGGIDVTPDGATVLVADRTFNTTTDRGLIHRVDASSGAVTTLDFPLDGGEPSFTETGSWDVVAMSNEKAFFTTDFVGSAWVPLHQLDLATNVITTRSDALGSGSGGEVRERTWLFRSGDHSTVMGLESDSSGGPFFSYSTLTDAFLDDGATSSFHSDGTGAVSENGSWLAVEVGNDVRVFQLTLDAPKKTLLGINGGVHFHPEALYLFGLDATTDQVVLYDLPDLIERFRLPAGTALDPTTRFDEGVASYDPKTFSLFVSVSQGIACVSTYVPEPNLAMQLAIGAALLIHRRRSRGSWPARTIFRAS